MCPDAQLRNLKCLLEVKEDWAPSAFNVTEKPEAVSIDTGALRLEAQRNPWKYVIYDRTGEIVLQEHVNDIEVTGDWRSLPIGFTTKEEKFYRSNETFYLTPGEQIYGFGEKFTRLNKVGQVIDGWNVDAWGSGTKDLYKHIPFLMSTRGYGVFVNTTCRLHGQIGSQSLMAYTLWIDDPRLDLFLIYGPSLKEVLARYEEITGWPSFPPKESFGIWLTPPESQWNGRASSERERVDAFVALGKKFRELNIPVDYFMLLDLPRAKGQTDKEQLAWTRDVSAAFGKIGIKTGLYTAPMLDMGSEMEQEARAHKYAVMRKDGSPYPALLENKASVDFGKRVDGTLASITRSDEWRASVFRATRDPVLLPDFTNPAAVKWWKDKIAERMKAGCYGIEMSDFAEEIPPDTYYYNKRTGLEMHNLYATLYQKANYEAVAESSGHRGLVNCRSGTAGMQRFPICWSGDTNCEWEDVVNTLRAGLSIGLSGVPFWSCDNAGFDDEHGHLTPELWIRWSQWSMFLSHVRLHGMGPVRAPWSFGDIAVENFRKYAKLRYRLLPYLYSHAYSATKTGLPIIRAMVLEFQDDPCTYHLEDQYMFGDAFLVAPVYTLVNKRTVYLPEGTWYDYQTGKEYTGPNTLHIDPPLEVLPLYVRGNSIIPMGPDMAYVGEKPFDPITLDIRLTSEAEFTLFDDDERGRTEEIVRCRASKRPDQIALELSRSTKTYIAKFNGTGSPARVSLNGVDLPRLGSQAALETAETGWYFDPSLVVYAKFRALGAANTLVLR